MNEPALFLLTDVASTEGYVIAVAVILLFLLARKYWHKARMFFLTATGLAITAALGKHAIQAPRPEGALIEVTGYGFPSGHAAGSMFLALALCALASGLPRFPRYVVYALSALFAVAVGTSRVYYMVHTPLQVFAGFLLGAFWALLFYALLKRMK